jgi:pimeloyl-ACP methyl ester carboxylesterase
MELTHQTEQVGSIRMHYVSEGTGPLVVLLHGFPEFWWSWRNQFAPLAQAGFRVVAPDLRGYNDTDRAGPYDLDTLAEDVVNLVRHLGEARGIIIGHDWGGTIAWYVAAKHPEVCERTVVLNAPHPLVFEQVIRSSYRQLRRSWYMLFFVLPGLPERRLLKDNARIMKRIYFANSVHRSPFSEEVLRRFREAIMKPGAATAALGYYRAALRTAISRSGDIARLPIINQPTLLIWGKDDPALSYDELVPPSLLWARDLWIEPIEHCGHFVHEERPDDVNRALLEFLQPGA